MEKILSNGEAEAALKLLPENEKEEIRRDIIRFGEYFIGIHDNKHHRVNPLNVITIDGKPQLVKPDSLTEI